MLLATVLVLLPIGDRHPGSLFPVVLSPFVALSQALARRPLTAATLWPLLILVAIVLRRRWFCRWLCPTGLLCDQAGQIRHRAASLERWPRAGRWAAIATLAGSALGFPLFLWLDPLAILNGTGGFLPWPIGWAAWLAVAGLPIVLGLSLVRPGAWCRRLCPLGGLQDLVLVAGDSCRGLLSAKPQAAGVAPATARRTLLAAAAGLIAAGGYRWWHRASRPRPLRPPGAADEVRFEGLCVRCGNCVRACPSRILAPDAGRFGWGSLLTPVVGYDQGYCLEGCTRCGDVCPSGAIARLPLAQKRQAVIGTARVDMEICALADGHECSLCKTHCPFDAVSYVFSQTDYVTAPHIDPQHCNGCGACQLACPTEPQKAIRVVVEG